MPDYRDIYRFHAAEYDELVACEDYQGNLTVALSSIVDLADKTVIEFGAGTGRLTQLLSRTAKEVHAFDSSSHMLSQAATNLSKLGFTNYTLKAANNLHTGAATSFYDVAIEGWSFGHSILEHSNNWRDAANALTLEMMRVVKQNGTCIIIETLGTGHDEPKVPENELGLFYEYLENAAGFERKAVRTDYRFESIEEASRVLSFFFG